jgi:hypothetical protein
MYNASQFGVSLVAVLKLLCWRDWFFGIESVFLTGPSASPPYWFAQEAPAPAEGSDAEVTAAPPTDQANYQRRRASAGPTSAFRPLPADPEAEAPAEEANTSPQAEAPAEEANTSPHAEAPAEEATASEPVVPTNVSGISKGSASTRRPHPT